MSFVTSARRFRQFVFIFVLGGYSWLFYNHLHQNDTSYILESLGASPKAGHTGGHHIPFATSTPTLVSSSHSPASLRSAIIATLRQRADEIWRQCIKINTKNYTEIVGAGDAKNNSPPLTDFLTAQLDSALSSTLIFLDNGITWCPVPKAASTSWAGALLRLQRPSTALLKKSAQVALKRRSRSVPADEVLSFVSASESFLVTRHPLHRVVSAFRNKLETSYGNHDGAYFYKNYGSQIVRKYRKLETVQLYKKAEENWLHFVQFTNIGNAVEDFPLIIKVEDNFNGKQRGVTIMKIMEILMMKYDLFAEKNSLHAPPAAVFRDPTFEEFVRYLIGANPAKLDEHWKSIHLYCQVCRVRYEFVLRYENLHDEATAFVQHLKSEGVLPQHFALHHDNKGGTSDHVIRKYLSLLPAQLLDKLISMYKSDLDIFDYKVDGLM